LRSQLTRQRGQISTFNIVPRTPALSIFPIHFLRSQLPKQISTIPRASVGFACA